MVSKENWYRKTAEMNYLEWSWILNTIVNKAIATILNAQHTKVQSQSNDIEQMDPGIAELTPSFISYLIQERIVKLLSFQKHITLK